MKTNTDSGASAGPPPGRSFRIHRASRDHVKSKDPVKSPRKILVIDDDKIILKTTSSKLKAAGYEVLTAEDGGSAIRQARQLQPHLILLDLNFPPDVGHGGGIPWDGFLILSWLRRTVEGEKIPVIVITGGDVEKYKNRWEQAGVRDIFLKPIDHDALLAAIRWALDEDVAGQNPAPTERSDQPPKKPEAVPEPAAVEPSSVPEPVAAAPLPVLRPVVAEPLPVLKPVVAKPAPVRKPVVAEPPPVPEPAAAEPSPLLEPVALEPSPVLEPVACRKILFVDDTSDWRYLGGSYLGERGYEVATAEDPISAMLQVSQFKPNLVVLDLNLAGQSAVPLLKILSKRHPEVRVLIYTAMDLDNAEFEELLNLGAWNWLQKGSLEELVTAVEKTISGPKATVPQSVAEPDKTTKVSLAVAASATHTAAEEIEPGPEYASALPSLDDLRTETTEELLSAVESARSETPEQTEEVPESVPEPPCGVPDEVIESAAESILIVDDDAAFADTLRSFLESQSFRVSWVATGPEALSLIAAADVDLILFDLTLPSLSVEPFYNAVKAAKPHLCPRIVFMTSDESHPTDDGFVRRLKGISLWKPFPTDWLIEAVQSIRAGTDQARLATK